MTNKSGTSLHLVSGRNHPKLAKEVVELGVTLSDVTLGNFANGEVSCKFNESVRGADVFIMQTHSDNVNDAIMEQAIMIDSAKRSSAGSITAVCPYLGYSGQDRKSSGREPISARLVIDIMAKAGADRIMSIDLHSGQSQGFFDGPFDHLIAMPTLIQKLAVFDKKKLVIVAPDAGRVKSAERYSSLLNCEMAIIHKHRSTKKHNTVEAKYLIGNVKNKICVMVDDMIDTAGTICSAADLLVENGAKEIYCIATHGILSDPAIKRISKSSITKIFVTDTLPARVPWSNKIETVSIAPLLASSIKAVFERDSVSAIFNGNNQM